MPVSSQLIKDCWAQSQQLLLLETSVNPSIPILWFGNEEEYENSQIRIVTIALNPSRCEFWRPNQRRYDVGFRFRQAVPLVGKLELNDDDVALYRAAMNEYFVTNPYNTYFRRFETPLNVLGGSYYPDHGMPHRAIHIDIYTPIATDPTWGHLTESEKSDYVNQNDFFDRLLDELDPQVILISTNRDVLQEKFGTNIVPGRYPYVHATRTDGRLLIAGRNMNGTPFAGMDGAYIQQAIQAIKGDYPEIA